MPLMNIEKITQNNIARLSAVSPTPDLDMSLIIEFVMGLSKMESILNPEYPVSEVELAGIEYCIQKRLTGTPIAYIIGYKEFYGRSFITTPDVLIPRPETEAMIDMSRHIFKDNATPHIWEIGTGSGCIAITLAREIPESHIVASDISAQALRIAQNNDILISGNHNTISWIISDLLECFPSSQPDMIIANLPYLDQNRYTDDSLVDEPDIALYSPQKGLSHYFKLITQIWSRFIDYPPLLIEINPEQRQSIEQFLHQYNSQTQITVYKDLQELDRHLLIQL